ARHSFRSARTLEFSVLAKYAFGVAQTFNAFYHRWPILAAERTDRRLWRAAGVAYVRAQLARTRELMGLDDPSRNLHECGLRRPRLRKQPGHYAHDRHHTLSQARGLPPVRSPRWR